MRFLKLFHNHEEYEEYASGETMVTPNVSHCIQQKEVHYSKKKYNSQYLTFKALESGTFTLTIGSAVTTGDVVSVSYSLDNGGTWTTTNNVQGQKVVITTPTVPSGGLVMWKGNNRVMSSNASGMLTHLMSCVFSSSGYYSVMGNIMSLIYGDDFKNKTSLVGKTASFRLLFNDSSKLKNAKKLSLPATTLASNCYESMFAGCTSLTVAPELPATTLAISCYDSMFSNCTSLTTAPELPATTLANQCYREMFRSCTSLTTAPELPATTLVERCYLNMFGGCRNLTTAPELPATTSAQYCYASMFSNCTSLTTAPELPATTLANYCYSNMFSNCTSLTTAPQLPATTLAGYCYQHMFDGCTSLTTAPELPATTLAGSCYFLMFYKCSGLTVAPELPATTLAISCYDAMFQGCTSLTTAPELPATTLASDCYSQMFSNCTSLTTAPELPATTLAISCYSSMFERCTSLATVPSVLPATTLASSCYRNMFQGCTSLTTAPELPATTLANSCYYEMFNGCTSLTTVPSVLPATTLAQNCYNSMFYNCTSLTTAPELPATTLAGSCYGNMFRGCRSLSSITCLATDISATNCTASWVSGVAASGTFIKADGMNNWTRGSNGIPTNWTVVDYYGRKPFTLKTNNGNDGVFTIGKETEKVIQYSVDNGLTWTTTSALSTTVTASTVMIKSVDRSTPWYDYVGDDGITCSINFHVEGNIMSLLYGDDYVNNETLINTAEFAGLFTNSSTLTSAKGLILPSTTLVEECYASMFAGCTSLTVAPELPATTLAQNCYNSMFQGCTSLTTAPELPATTLTSYCYSYMFQGCTSLTTAPELPATTLATRCYQNMFQGCTSLTTAPELPATTLTLGCYRYMFYTCSGLTVAPELPATTLEQHCYNSMFRGCTSLTTAPELPATTLAQNCYNSMFQGCTSLVTAPELPATTLATGCYQYMFSGCTSLNSITCLATNISASDCTSSWVRGVAASGTFTKAPSMTGWTTGVNGIPTNWTVRDYGAISASLVMYVDDFPEDKMDGESKETVMTRQLNSSDECNIGNKYVYTGETITYNGNTYYLWEMSDDCGISSNVAYLLTTTDNFNTLYRQSLKNNLTNHFTSLVGRLDGDKEVMYSADEIGSEYELYLVKIIDNNPASLRIWVDDFPEDAGYDEGSAQDKMTAEVDDPAGEGANPYEYLGETIVYNGNTYYLWQAVEGYNVDNSMTRYFATTTVDFNTLYSQSLEDDLTNRFYDAIGMFDDSKSIYIEQGEMYDGSDVHYLVKVEDLS